MIPPPPDLHGRRRTHGPAAIPFLLAAVAALVTAGARAEERTEGVRVLVVGPDGTPRAGAPVSILPPGEARPGPGGDGGDGGLPLPRPLLTGGDGTVSLAPLLAPHDAPWTRTFEVLTWSADGLASVASLTVSGVDDAPPAEPLRLVLREAHVLAGRVEVSAPPGAPIPRATVARVEGGLRIVTDGGEPRALPVAATVAGDGRFTLGPVARGTHRVAVTLEGGTVWAGFGVRAPAKAPQALVLAAAAPLPCRAAGADGSPLAAATFLARFTPPPGGPAGVRVTARARAGDDGTASLEGLPAGGRGVVIAHAPGLVPADGAPAITLPADGTALKPVMLVPARGAAVVGRVVDDRGEPVAGATLRLRGAGASWPLDRLPPAVSGADGVFRFPAAPAGPAEIFAEAEGLLPAGDGAGPPVVTVPAEGDAAVTVAMVRAGAASGTVVDADGAPLPRVRVLVQDVAGTAAAAARTDEEGRFRVAGLRPGRPLVAAVRDRDGGLAPSPPFTVPPGGEATGVAVRVARRGTLTLRLVPGNGESSLPGAVVLRAGAPPAPTAVPAHPVAGDVRAAVAADGVVRVADLPPGPRLVLGDRGDPWLCVLGAFESQAGRDVDLGNVTVPAPRIIEGTVTGAAGPVDGARVTLVPGDPFDGGFRTEGGVTVVTDATGRFRHGGAPAGPAAILVDAPGFARRGVALPAAAEAPLAVTLVPAARIEGTVAAAATGAPVAGARVSAAPGSPLRPAATSVSGEDGSFRLDGLDDGAYTLRAVDASENLAAAPLRGVRAGDGPVAFAMRPARTIAGRIVDEADRAVVGDPPAAVDVFAADAAAGEDPLATLFALPDGSFRVGGLPPDALRVRVRPPAEPLRRFRDGTATVPAGEGTATVIVPVVRWARVRGAVRLDGRAPPQPGEGRVVVLQEGGDGGPATALPCGRDAGGRFVTVFADPARPCTVVASGFDGFADARVDGVRPGEEPLILVLQRTPARGEAAPPADGPR